MIYVVATIQLTAGQREAFLTEQRHLLPLVRGEAGCLEYTPTVEVSVKGLPDEPPSEDIVVMQEKWESLDALRAHFTAGHMRQFREKMKSVVVGTTVEVFETI